MRDNGVYDVIIIGAGTVGSCMARELSRYDIRLLLLEKGDDVCSGTSKATGAVIPGGFQLTPGTYETYLALASYPLYERMFRELDVRFREIATLLVAFTPEEKTRLRDEFYLDCFKNGTLDVEWLGRDELLAIEPMLNPDVIAGIHAPRNYIFSPFDWVIGLTENAVANGVELVCSAEVLGISPIQGGVRTVSTRLADFRGRWIVNTAGLYCDEIARMVGIDDFVVTPRKGQCAILDNGAAYRLRTMLAPVPTGDLATGRGVCIRPTVYGNLLLGGTHDEQLDKEDKDVTAEGLHGLFRDARRLLPALREKDVIHCHAGLRAVRHPEGVHIDRYPAVNGFICISGVRSTGFMVSPAIAVTVREMLVDAGLPMHRRKDFQPVRKRPVCFSEQPTEVQQQLVRDNPDYGEVICRCETVTKAEILQAIRGMPPAWSLDAIKRRVSPGMGRCQGGHCGPRIARILAEELGVPLEQVTLRGVNSNLVLGALKAPCDE